MNAFIVELENRPGELARLAEAVGQRGINMTAIGAAASGGAGGIGLVTNDESGTREALQAAGISAREIGLVSLNLEHRAGTLAEVARKLADAGVNVELLLATGMSGSNVSIALGVDDVEAAQRVVGQSQSVQA
jgi:hypothetical protein